MAKIFAGSGADFGNESERQFETSLISLVKFLPCLYDTSNPNYNDMQQNKVAWFKLSNTLKKSVTECINKWYSLLQIFLCLNKQLREQDAPSPITWPHYYAMLRLHPNLNVNYFDLVQEKPPFFYSRPVLMQKEKLVNLMEIHREILLSPDISIEQKQKIWLQIAKKLNAVVNGVNMPVIKWQKYWCDLKQATLDIRLRQNRANLTPDVVEPPKYSDDDIKILQFCGVKGTDPWIKIHTALTGATEIGCDLDKVVSKCGRCNGIIQGPVNQKFCNACGLLPKTFCDICLRVYHNDLRVYELKNWSMDAKNLLPPHLSSFASISACDICSDDLKRNAGANWKACRICENYHHPLDNLFSSGNEVLRKAFMDATNITFKETDGLPGYICKVCKVQMQQFNNFYLKFNRVQTRLNEIHDEFFIGVPGIILTQNTEVGRDSLNLPLNRVPVLKSNSNTSLGSGKNEEIKHPAVVQTVQQFTIPSSASHCPAVKINKNVQIKHIVMPATDNACIAKAINRINVPLTVPASVVNTVKTGKLATAQGLQTLQLLQGVPVITKKSLPASVVVNGIAKKQIFKPILPKPAPVKISTNTVSKKNAVVIKPVNVRAPVSGVMSLQQTTLTKEKPSTPKMVAPATTTTISGILAQHKLNGPLPSSITIKTQSGTTTLSPTPVNIQTSNVKGTTITSSTSSATLANNNNLHRKTVYPEGKVAEPISSPTVFQIADDMLDPNSPPAFCIPKSGSQIQGTAFTVIPGNSKTNQPPQKTVATPENIPPVVDATKIKTEKLDEDELIDGLPVKKNDLTKHSSSAMNESLESFSTTESCPSPSEATDPSQQTPGNIGKPPEKAKNVVALDTGVKKPQQNPTQQQQPSSGNKRPRKYWGAVDEFHIPSKVANVPTNEICSQVSIKQEGVDPDEENINKDELSLNMFYPDSFELGNVSLDADVTSVLKHMIAHHQKSTDPETYQFTFDEANTQREFKTNDESKKKDKSKKKNDYSAEDVPKENKNTSKLSNLKKFPVKKLRIRLMRNKKLETLELSKIKTDVVARSCTFARRKSMRLNKIIS